MFKTLDDGWFWCLILMLDSEAWFWHLDLMLGFDACYSWYDSIGLLMNSYDGQTNKQTDNANSRIASRLKKYLEDSHTPSNLITQNISILHIAIFVIVALYVGF